MNEMERQNVTRGEFGQFQKTVTDGFTKLETLIAKQSEATSKSLSMAFDRIAAVQQPDKRSIIAAAGVVLALMVAIGGVLNQRMDGLDVTLQREMRELNEAQDVAIRQSKEELNVLRNFVFERISRDLDELNDRRRNRE